MGLLGSFSKRKAPLTDSGISLNLFGASPFTSNGQERHIYSPLSTSQDTVVEREEYLSRASSSLCLAEDNPSSPPPGYKPPLSFLDRPDRPRRRSRRCVLTIAALAGVVIAYSICFTLFRPPSYVVLPPELYFDTLNQTAQRYIPAESHRQAIVQHLEQIKFPAPTLRKDAQGLNPQSLVPNTIWSSDGKPAPGKFYTQWLEMGADPKFLDDAAMEAWVVKHWNGTEIKKVWDDLPRFILKADLLRYLLVIIEGGTWSDMDTVPLMPLSQWAKDTTPFSSRRGKGSPSSRWKKVSEATAREPIRAIVGIECDPTEDETFRSWPERLRLLPLNRHRPLQFVQWTLHMTPNHPILLDVLRRIAEATDIYRADEIEHERQHFTHGWGWKEEAGDYKKAKPRKGPWETMKMKLKWEAGNWRMGWDATSVEEWTGPAAYTDSVVSYLYASAGVRPEDLAGLTHPVQVRDVVIVPSKGFNPVRGIVPGTSRLVHNFRGSWKA